MRAFVHDVPRAWQAWCDSSSTSFSSVYACLVLATPVRAFVYDVSPGLANPPRPVVNNIFSPAHPYFDTTAPMLTRRPLRPRLHDDILNTGSPTRHRPRHSSHGYLDHGYTILRSRLPRHRLSSLTVRDAPVVRNATATTAGDVRDIFGILVFGSLGFVIRLLP